MKYYKIKIIDGKCDFDLDTDSFFEMCMTDNFAYVSFINGIIRIGWEEITKEYFDEIKKEIMPVDPPIPEPTSQEIIMQGFTDSEIRGMAYDEAFGLLMKQVNVIEDVLEEMGKR